MRLPLCVLLAWLLALPPVGVVSAAPAGGVETQGEVKLGVLPLKVAGQVDEETRAGWAAGLRRGLLRGSFALVEEAALARVEAGCAKPACRERAREAGATHVVRTEVVMKSRDFLLALEVLDVASGEVVVRSAETCEICGVGEVTELLDSQGALLQTRLAQLKAPSLLVLDSRPRGAVVEVDGEVVGTTPLERPLLVGGRKIRVSLEGFVAEERLLTVVPGGREELVVDLRRVAAERRRRGLAGAALGGGLGLFGAGVTLLALDDRPYKKRCTGAAVDVDGDCRWLLNTSWGGAALAVSGAVLVTLGIVSLVRNRAARKKRAATVLPTGLGLTAQF